MCNDEKQMRRLLAAQKRIEIQIGRPLLRNERKRVAALLEERDPLAGRWAIWLYCNRRKISAIIWAGRLDHMVKSICYEMGDMKPVWRYFGPVRFGVYSDQDRLSDRAWTEKWAIMLPDDYAKQTEYALHVHRDIEGDENV
jgi:hypothetical protein